MVFPGDILLVKTGSSYGKVALVDSLPQPATINPQFVVLKHIKIDRFYLTYLLQSEYARKKYEEFVIGTAIPTFTQEALNNMRIPLPPYAEQRRIVIEVEKWFDTVQTITDGEHSLAKGIESCKSKILDLAIHGKLVPQDPSDEPAIELLKRINPDFKPSDNLHYDVTPVNGWVLVEFKEVFDSISSKPYQIAMSEIKDIGRFPVISQGSKIIDGYSDNVERVFKTGVPVYVFGDHTKVLKYVPHDFIVGADGVKILKPRWDSKYLFYHLLYCVSNMENRGYSRNYQYLSSSVLHIPPIAEQNRIVSAIEMLFKELDSISIVTTK